MERTLKTSDTTLKTSDIVLKAQQSNETIDLSTLSIEELKALLEEEMEKFPTDEEEFRDYIDDMIYPKARKVLSQRQGNSQT